MQRLTIQQLLLIAALLLTAKGAAAQDMNCSDCYQRNRPLCEHGCDDSNTRFGFSQCADNCVNLACSALCSKKGTAPVAGKKRPAIDNSDMGTLDGKGGITQPRNTREQDDEDEVSGFDDGGTAEIEDKGPCGRCLHSMSESCTSECMAKDPETISECKPRCANRHCADKCQLPGSVTKEAPPPRPADCARCKHSADETCKQHCGDNKERAGYTACVISCGEEKCNTLCNPGSFE